MMTMQRISRGFYRLNVAAFWLLALGWMLSPPGAAASGGVPALQEDLGETNAVVQQVVDGLCGGDPGSCDAVAGPEGPQGPPGEDGQDGTSCSVSQGADSATIDCDDGTTATVYDGADGAEGPEGPQGPEGPAGPDPRFGSDTSMAAAGRGDSCTLGEVWLTAGVVASGAPANGQLLQISQNSALFSLLGTIYGGDGQATFALPDLRDAAPNGLTYVICVEGFFPSHL